MSTGRQASVAEVHPSFRRAASRAQPALSDSPSISAERRRAHVRELLNPLLMAWREDRLSATAKEKLALHFDACSGCGEFLTQLAKTWSLQGSEAPLSKPPPPDPRGPKLAPERVVEGWRIALRGDRATIAVHGERHVAGYHHQTS